MKRYDYCVQVSYPIDEVWKLDCVVGIRKCKNQFRNIYGVGMYSDNWIEVDLKDGAIARLGDWLMRDVCGHWTVMCDEDYLKHKDDEI